MPALQTQTMITCILVDDEPTFTKNLAEYIKNHEDFELQVNDIFHNADDAMDYIKSHIVDLVITDVKMGSTSGLDLAEILADVPYTETIIITAYSNFHYACTGIDSGILAYLTKPIDYEKFDKTIYKAKKIIKNKYMHHSSAPEVPSYISKNTETSIKSTKESIIERAAAYINQNYTNQALSLQTVADTLYLSPVYFSRIFAEVTGETFSSYLTKIRMQKAIELLGQKAKIENIASSIGYSSGKYFSRRFKSFTGMTPIEYYRKRIMK